MTETSNKNRNFLRSSGLLALATFLSRFLGFFREILTAGIIGADTVMTAWVLASTLPNMFRRILGEGALGTALVPMISHTLELEGHESARKKFSTILIWLTLLLALITLLVSVPAWLIAPHVETERVHLALKLTPLIMPYCIFICIVGIMTSLMNSLRVFFLPALAALSLNVLMIGALFLLCPHYEGATQLDILAIAVLLSGVIEVLMMVYLIRREKMGVIFSKAVFFDWSAIKEIWTLALPGIVGASALQLSLVVDRSIACYLGDYAAPALYNSDRLIYLPIGIFAIAFGTVSLTEMSRSAAVKDYKSMVTMMMYSMRHLLFITVPMAAFMLLFSVELIRLCFYRGAFGDRALAETSYAFFFYAFGIPAFAAIKITLAGFYSRKDMVTPVIVSVCCIVLNIVLNLILMWPLKQGGIALSTVICSFLNNIILLYILNRNIGSLLPFREFFHFGGKLLAVSLLPLYPASLAYEWTVRLLPVPDFSSWSSLWTMGGRFMLQLIPLSCAAIVFGGLFLGLGFLFRMKETEDFASRFLKRRKGV